MKKVGPAVGPNGRPNPGDDGYIDPHPLDPPGALYPQDYSVDQFNRPKDASAHISFHIIRPTDAAWDDAREKIYDAIVDGFMANKTQPNKNKGINDMHICGKILPLTYVLRLSRGAEVSEKKLTDNKVKYMESLINSKPPTGETKRNLIAMALNEHRKCVGYVLGAEYDCNGNQCAYVDLICSFKGVGGRLFDSLMVEFDNKDEVRLNAVTTALYFYNKKKFKFGDTCDTPFATKDKELQITDRYWHTALNTNQLPRSLYDKLKSFYDHGLIDGDSTVDCKSGFDRMYNKNICIDAIKMIKCPTRPGWDVPAP